MYGMGERSSGGIDPAGNLHSSQTIPGGRQHPARDGLGVCESIYYRKRSMCKLKNTDTNLLAIGFRTGLISFFFWKCNVLVSLYIKNTYVYVENVCLYACVINYFKKSDTNLHM